MILATEGMNQQSSATEVAATSLAATELSQVAERRGDITEPLKKLLSEASSEFRTSLLPGIKQGGRLQVKGDEARAQYQESKASLVSAWDSCISVVLRMTSADGLFANITPLSAEAVRVPAANLKSLAATAPQTKQASAYSLQLLAGAASVAAMGRPVDPFFRLRIEEGGVFFPRNANVRVTQTTDGYVTEIATTPVPAELGLQVGDTVEWGGGTATISSVGTLVTLTNSSLFRHILKPTVIRSSAGADYQAMAALLLPNIRALPQLSSRLLEKLEKLESRPRDAAEYLGQLMQLLGPVTADAQESLSRQGVYLPSPQLPAISDTLLAYAPVFRTLTKGTGKSAIQTLRSQGFDRASDLLIEMYFEAFLETEAEESSYSARVGKAAPGLVQLIGETFQPVVGGVNRNG